MVCCCHFLFALRESRRLCASGWRIIGPAGRKPPIPVLVLAERNLHVAWTVIGLVARRLCPSLPHVRFALTMVYTKAGWKEDAAVGRAEF